MALKIKIGDEVELYNGMSGIVSNINFTEYTIEIHGIWFHIVNIKYLNGEDCECISL